MINTIAEGVGNDQFYKLFSIFAGLGNFDADFDPLYSSKLNESKYNL